ncbi:MAG TPA: hypothetical protein VNO30_44605 [Kofleriaceae bacterium]|nr:hypothetical protein [Kofleriaceae bacterium]
MRFAWVCLAAMLGIAGCETGTGNNELGICSTLCRCSSGLPSQQRACIDECLEIAGSLSTRACETCVFENATSCEHMAKRCFQSQVCDFSDPEPEPDPVPPIDL